MKEKMLCIYHAKCLDGLTAAAIVYTKHEKDYEIEFYPATYGTPPPDALGRDVFIVDFSYPPDVIEEMAKQASEIIVIDHHKTAIEAWVNVPKEDIPDNVTLKFDLNYSGAGLTFKTLFGHHCNLRMINYVQDYDLWKKELPDCDCVVAGLFNCKEFREADIPGMAKLIVKVQNEEYFDEILQSGKVIYSYQQAIVKQQVDRLMRIVNFGGVAIPVVNLSYEQASAAGEYIISLGHDAAIIYEDDLAHGVRKYSMRTRKGSGFDAAKFCEVFGGGGHAQAAGFYTKLDASFVDHFKIFPANP